MKVYEQISIINETLRGVSNTIELLEGVHYQCDENYTRLAPAALVMLRNQIDTLVEKMDNLEGDIRELEEAAPKKKEKKQKPPATPADRKAAKEELTQADGNATEEQITSLKTICKTLMDMDEEQEEFVQQIALKTNGFTQIAASACEELIKNLEEMVAAYNG